MSLNIESVSNKGNQVVLNRIGADGVEAIMKVAYKILSITNNNLGPEEARQIAKGILKDNQSHPSLRQLKLKNNNLGNEGAVIILEAVKKHQLIMLVDIRKNGITSKGAKEIANVLGDRKVFIKI